MNLDKALLIFVGWFFAVVFFVWSLANIFKTNNYLIWVATVPLGLLASILLTRQYQSNLSQTHKKSSFAYAVFIFLLIFSVIYYLEPMIRYPNATLGIPNKDLHDGISVFIADNGYPPPDTAEFAKNSYILSSQNGLYLGYPNVLHSFSALLIKFGAGEFYATWFAVIIAMTITSIALFFLLKFIYDDYLFVAIVAGLFPVSTFRLSYAAVASMPMFFSLLLILPALYIFMVSLKKGKSWQPAILPAVSISLLMVSYGGTISLFAGILFVLALTFWLFRKRDELSSLLRLVLYSLPILAFCLLFLKTIYWQNTFPTIKDFDPYELSQRLLPVDVPIYMGFLFLSSIVFIYFLLRKKESEPKSVNKIFFYILTLGFMIPIVFYLIFHQINYVPNSEALVGVPPGGIFGGLNHQKMMRLSLVQPFFFIFFLGYAVYFLKKPWRYFILAALLLSGLIIRINIPVYQVIAPEVRESFYNQNDKDKPYTLLSHLRLVVNDQIWSQEILTELNQLKKDQPTGPIILLDERGWTEESIANWGSIYLRRKIFRPKDFGINNFPSGSIVFAINPERRVSIYRAP